MINQVQKLVVSERNRLAGVCSSHSTKPWNIRASTYAALLPWEERFAPREARIWRS
jgi:hypothetical protein